MKVLGISCFYHDSAASLVIGNKIVAALEEEKLSRKKHDSEFPKLAIDFCLKKGNLKPQELDWVIFYEKPLLKFDRILENHLKNYPFSFSSFPDSMIASLGKKIWIKNLIANYLKIDPKKILFSDHHLSHAASTFYCSDFNSAAILTFDGVGEWATTTIGRGFGKKIEVLKEINFPDSLALLYSTFTAYLGFEVNEGEYKVMGLASYGKPEYLKKIKKLYKIFPDSSFKLNLDYFQFHVSKNRSYSEKFLELFGPAFSPGTFDNVIYNNPSLHPEFTRAANIATSIQKATEELILNLVNEVKKLTGEENLCLAGGVALNSAANYKIFESGIFKNIYIQPASGDAGGALGAALLVNNLKTNRKAKFETAFLGQEFSEKEIETVLKRKKLKYKKLSERSLNKFIAEKIFEGKTVGWFKGRSEWGPRSLGARSILATPAQEKMKEIVNQKIKFRETFRPFAPSVLEEEADKFFSLGKTTPNSPSSYMLYVAKVKDKLGGKIPAVVHIDKTARPQVVWKKQNPSFYKLIKEFYKLSGIPILLNTSFNLRGEPIVNKPEEAIETFLKSGLDLLVLENFVCEKR